MKRVVYNIYSPIGKHVKTCLNLHQAKKVLRKYNSNTPSWHYDELYTMSAEVVYVNS